MKLPDFLRELGLEANLTLAQMDMDILVRDPTWGSGQLKQNLRKSEDCYGK